ncbi:hypothetical protein [Sneathiella litorea]|uniref:Lipoprotein n=1 Tax=Sneathiella litorea TaxID=2606216 RepID=A0A6L8W7R6_9PROT|nr:hypothetical protein [Sneathiella litorea]MZR31118.1 hypothetical protein [Sneathiella litorea]
MNFIAPIIRVVCLAAIVAACTADGGTNNPVFRPFQWFSYVNGDDIRANCAPGRNARYRMIYNAIYDEQVRTYDITQITTSDSATQTTRAFRGGISVNWLLGAVSSGPAATHDSKVVISIKDLVAVEQALIKSGFEKPAIKGQILHSDEFYWVAMVCRDGNFKYYAWTDDNADIAKLPFREVLSKGDKTGVSFQEPYVPVVFGRSSRYYNGGRDSTYFTLQVGDNGLDL